MPKGVAIHGRLSELHALVLPIWIAIDPWRMRDTAIAATRANWAQWADVESNRSNDRAPR
eukprot:SAG31_NODE_2555_length_5496_cov_13.099314_2_plen_60_part_00